MFSTTRNRAITGMKTNKGRLRNSHNGKRPSNSNGKLLNNKGNNLNPAALLRKEEATEAGTLVGAMEEAEGTTK